MKKRNKKKEPKFLFSAQAPVTLDNHIGKEVTIPTFVELDGKRTKIAEERIRIETIVGNRITPQFYEINGTHLIGMLRFHAQMLGAKDISEDQFHAFEEMDLHAEKIDKEKEMEH